MLELIRYIHLNPLRAGLVKSLDDLAGYPWCGHGALLGGTSLSGQVIDEVLARFGNKAKAARLAYRQFVADGVSLGKRPDLTGGGLRRSQLIKGSAEVPGDYDERILGSGEFVASLREEPRLSGLLGATIDLSGLQALVCDYFSLPEAALARRGRQNRNSEARELFCYLAVRELKYSGGLVGTAAGMGSSSVSRAARRGEELFASREECREWWSQVLKH